MKAVQIGCSKLCMETNLTTNLTTNLLTSGARTLLQYFAEVTLD